MKKLLPTAPAASDPAKPDKNAGMKPDEYLNDLADRINYLTLSPINYISEADVDDLRKVSKSISDVLDIIVRFGGIDGIKPG